MKTVLFSILFLLNYAMMALAAAKAPAKGPAKGPAKTGSKPKGKNTDTDTDQDQNAVLRSACYTNCESMPGRTDHKMAVFLCQQICDKNHPSGPTFGCYKNYCWSSCSGAGIGKEWCYTTKGRSQDFGYVKCTTESECNKDWHCAGSCTI